MCIRDRFMRDCSDGEQEPKEKLVLSIMYHHLLTILYDNLISNLLHVHDDHRNNTSLFQGNEVEDCLHNIIKLLNICGNLMKCFMKLNSEHTVNYPTVLYYRPMHSLTLLVRLKLVLKSSRFANVEGIADVIKDIDIEKYFADISKIIVENQKVYNSVAVSYTHLDVYKRQALDIGFQTLSPETAKTKPKFVYLLGADEISNKDIPKDAFVVYQGHHGDLGASFADVILPGSAYTEKSATYVNTEGRTQVTRAATNPPGVAREDWKIVRALSEYLDATLPYDDIVSVRIRLGEIAPHLVRHDVIEPASSDIAKIGFAALVSKNKSATISGTPLKNPIDNFYFTDVISRSSPTMARCISSFGAKVDKITDDKPDINF